MSFSDLCFFPNCWPPTPKSKVPSCLRAPNWSLYITLASHSGLFRMSKCHVIPLPETDCPLTLRLTCPMVSYMAWPHLPISGEGTAVPHAFWVWSQVPSQNLGIFAHAVPSVGNTLPPIFRSDPGHMLQSISHVPLGRVSWVMWHVFVWLCV